MTYVEFPGQSLAQQGWQCPVCKTVHAPFMPSCPYCAPKRTVTTPRTSGCPQCGKQTPSICSAPGCPNYGTTCKVLP